MICKLNARAAQARNARATLLHLHCCTARMMHGLCLTGGTMRGGRHGVAACGVREALEVHSVPCAPEGTNRLRCPRVVGTFHKPR